MKSVQKILDYQKTIVRLLSKKGFDLFELENICLHRLGHVACWESYIHALEDLVSNGRISKIGSTVFIKQ